jgi:hypothetical protein
VADSVIFILDRRAIIYSNLCIPLSN